MVNLLLDSIELLINKAIKDNLDVCIGLLKYIKDDKEYNINICDIVSILI